MVPNIDELYPRSIADSGDWMEKRNKARQGRRKTRSVAAPIAFDCFNCHYRNGRAVCVRARRLYTSADGSLALRSVLRGFTPSVCRSCAEFETEADPYERA